MSTVTITDLRAAPLELWTYSEFETLIPHTNARNLVRLSDRKKFPPFTRMTPRGEPLWAKVAILRYVERVYRPLMERMEADSELTELGHHL